VSGYAMDAVDAGIDLGKLLSGRHDRTKVAARMQQQMMEKIQKELPYLTT